MKTWKPDTCECIVEEIYNGSEIVGGGQVIKKCVAHEAVLDNELYGVLYANPDGENKIKNQMFRILLGYEDIKDLGLEEQKFDKFGMSTGIGLKEGIEYSWFFEGVGKSRVLRVELKGVTLTKTKKDSLKSLCESKFGNGKVQLI